MLPSSVRRDSVLNGLGFLVDTAHVGSLACVERDGSRHRDASISPSPLSAPPAARRAAASSGGPRSVAASSRKAWLERAAAWLV
jgi:hypothetical protein